MMILGRITYTKNLRLGRLKRDCLRFVTDKWLKPLLLLIIT